MISLNYKEIYSIDQLIAFHNEIKTKARGSLLDIQALNIPISIFLTSYSEFELLTNERLVDFISNWKELSSKHCKVL